jgi:anti-sigma factor RsiW
MRSDGAWDRDPVPDPLLRRLLGRVSVPRLAEQDAGRLEAAIMSAVRREAARATAPAWWEVAARWAPAAAAAGLAAVILSGLVLFGSPFSSSSAPEAAPETAAVAQVIGRYPGDAVLASLISGDDSDTLSPWSEP